MPAAFTRSFAERLDQICPLRVVEASGPLPAEPGTIFIARGGADMLLARRAGKLMVLPKPEDGRYLWHPSVDCLALSALECCDPARMIAVLLTGMGHDGADAFAEIRKRGGRTIAESEESSVVFGMPAELIKRGGATIVLPSTKVAAQINTWTGLS